MFLNTEEWLQDMECRIDPLPGDYGPYIPIASAKSHEPAVGGTYVGAPSRSEASTRRLPRPPMRACVARALRSGVSWGAAWCAASLGAQSDQHRVRLQTR